MDSFRSYFADVSAILLTPDRPLIMDVNGITPAQQIIASSTGAMLTSVFSKLLNQLFGFSTNSLSFAATPLDVVKVRLQSQVKGLQQEVCAVCYTAFLGHHDCHVIDGAAGRAAIPRSIPTPRFNGTLVSPTLRIVPWPFLSSCPTGQFQQQLVPVFLCRTPW